MRVNDIMATRNFRASDIVEALFDKDLGLVDSETSSDDDEDERIHGYLGSSFFAPSGSHELDRELDSVLARDEDLSTGSENEALNQEDMPLTSNSAMDCTHRSADNLVTDHSEAALQDNFASCPTDSTVSTTP